jgi:hypothetical protein
MLGGHRQVMSESGGGPVRQEKSGSNVQDLKHLATSLTCKDPGPSLDRLDNAPERLLAHGFRSAGLSAPPRRVRQSAHAGTPRGAPSGGRISGGNLCRAHRSPRARCHLVPRPARTAMVRRRPILPPSTSGTTAQIARVCAHRSKRHRAQAVAPNGGSGSSSAGQPRAERDSRTVTPDAGSNTS